MAITVDAKSPPPLRHHCSGWSGYFTSRAALKGYIRESTMWQTAARQLGALARDDTAVSQLLLFEQAMGLGQHHDAVTGTAKQAVTWDLQKRVSRSTACMCWQPASHRSRHDVRSWPRGARRRRRRCLSG
jgi:hypothetical protein